MYKIRFYTLSTRQNEKTYAIFERPTKESADALITQMREWGKKQKGNYQNCWEFLDDNFKCIARDTY